MFFTRIAIMMVLLRVGRLQYTIVQVSKERQTTLGETHIAAANGITFTHCSETLNSLSFIVVKLLRVQRLLGLALSVQEALPVLWQPATLQEVFMENSFDVVGPFLNHCFHHKPFIFWSGVHVPANRSTLGSGAFFVTDLGFCFCFRLFCQFQDLI